VTTFRVAIVALVVVLLGAWAGRHLLDSLNDPHEQVLAALHANADPPRESAAPAPHHRLVIVLIDGLGAEPFEHLVDAGELGVLPDMRAYIDVGAPSFSRPFYHQLLTGVPQPVSGIRTNAYPGRARADDLSARVRDAGGSVAWALESVTWFATLFAQPADTQLLGAAAHNDEQMAALYEAGADLIVWHLIRVDVAGHAHGAASEAYHSEALDAVRLVRRVRERVAQHPDAARTIWFVGADHGHLPAGGHGGPELAVRRTLWVGLWPTNPQRSIVLPTYVPATRLAATFAHAMGVDAPREVLGDALPLPDVAPVRLGHLAARERAVHAAFDRSTSTAHHESMVRMLVAALALAIAAIVLSRRGHGRRIAMASLAVIAACIGFALLGPGFTLSAIRTQPAFLARTIASMAFGCALVWPALRARGGRAIDAVIASGLPALIVLFVTWGSLGRAGVDPYTMLLGPTSAVLTAGVALGVLVGELASKFMQMQKVSRGVEAAPEKIVEPR
jgi:hypothetical protein